MFFGKNVLLPVMCYTLFALLTQLSKNLHNFIAPLFIVSVAVMVIIWLRDNVFRSYDWQWFRRAWAFFLRSEHIPSGRFNGGEKAWFWGGVIGLSIVVAWSGLVLLFPNFDQTRALMQDAWVWHASAALLTIGLFMIHIYMSVFAERGAFQSAVRGDVSEEFARRYHPAWYKEVVRSAPAPRK